MRLNISQDTYQIEREAHPALFAATEELSKKAGVEMPAIRFFKPGTAYFSPAAAAIYNDKHVLLFNEASCKNIFLTDLKHPTQISEEFKAVMAHEFGHIARKDITLIKKVQYVPMACILGAIGGLYAYRTYQEKHANSKELDRAELEAVVRQHVPAVEKKESPLLHSIGVVALYTATALAGSVSGAMIRRQVMHNMEYACDAFSKKIIGSGEPLARAFEMIKDSNQAALDYVHSLSEPARTDALMKMKQMEIMDFFLHPPTDKRIAALRS